MPKLFNWLPWGMKTHAMNRMKMLNQIMISALSLIRLMENHTIMLRYEDKGTKKDHVVQINIPVEDLLESDLLTYTCNMTDSSMQCKHDDNTNCPASNDTGSKQQNDTRAISKPDSPGPSANHCEGLTIGSKCAKIMELLKELSDDEMNLDVPGSPSNNDSETMKGHTALAEASQPQVHRPFISVSDEVMKNVSNVALQLEAYESKCHEMQRLHT
jgi:hypothetical protein